MIRYFFLVSRQGKCRLCKFYDGTPVADRHRVLQQVTAIVTQRNLSAAQVVEKSDHKIVYRRYASLYFIMGIEPEANELMCLELIHHLVEMLDRYFGNVCELDLIFNFTKVQMMVDELIMNGELQETSKKTILRLIAAQDVIIEDASANSSGILGGDFNKKMVHSL